MDARLFHKRLFDAARGLMPAGSGAVCGVSGGVDSMALMCGLQAVSEMRGNGWKLHVAHLDHGLREDSAADGAFVREAAGRLGLGCVVESADVRAAARDAGETVEEAGRRLRYGFLERVAIDNGARVVAVGHHADDQAETVLHHIVRGTGLRGLSGMRPRRPIRDGSDVELVRPLLGFRRAELLAYLAQQGVSYREDPTNADDQASTRNLIRHRVLPMLESSMNPEVRAALLRLSAQARQAEEAIGAYAAEALNRARIRRGRGEVALSADAVAALPEAIGRELVVMVLRDLGVGLQAVGQERIAAAAGAASGDGGRRLIELPGGVTVDRRGGELRIRRAEAED